MAASGVSPGPGISAPLVRAIAPYGQDLIVGGYFSGAGGIPADNIAGWNGTNWYSLGSGIIAPSVLHGVYALAEYSGALYAGGAFTTAGGNPANFIARWDGASWSAVGMGANEAVEALTIYEGDRIAGGSFGMIGGQFTAIGRWDGTQWHSMNALGAWIKDLHVHNGVLYAALQAEFGFSGVIRWTGSEWVAVAPYSNTWGIRSLASFGGDLIAAGYLSNAPAGQSAIRRWDGSAWVSLGAGIAAPGEVYALQAHQGVLHVGGTFLSAGGLPSPYWARWGCACYADCNNSSSLTVADFGCFQAQFAQGQAYADCNDSGSLTIADFGCFQAKFAGGCP